MISDARHRAELNDLGFEVVPAVQIGDRAFQAFPEEALRASLGLEPRALTTDDLRQQSRETSAILRTVAGLIVALPNSAWDEQFVSDRDRPTGQWVWHIPRFAEEVVEASSRGVLLKKDLLALAEKRHFPSTWASAGFQKVARYCSGVADDLQEWALDLDDEAINQATRSPFGTLPLSGLLDHVHRHSSIHGRQLVEWLASRGALNESQVAAALQEFPLYASLRPD